MERHLQMGLDPDTEVLMDVSLEDILTRAEADPKYARAKLIELHGDLKAAHYRVAASASRIVELEEQTAPAKIKAGWRAYWNSILWEFKESLYERLAKGSFRRSPHA